MITGISGSRQQGLLDMSSHLAVPTHLQGRDSKAYFTHENMEALCSGILYNFTRLHEWKAWVLELELVAGKHPSFQCKTAPGKGAGGALGPHTLLFHSHSALLQSSCTQPVTVP